MTRRFVLPSVLAVAMFFMSTGCESNGPTDPGAVTVTGVTVTASTTTVEAGGTLQLVATVQPEGAAQGVTWSTSDADRATVSSSGLVQGVAPGTVTITATSTSNPAVTGTITLACECPQPRIVSINLSGDTTWEDWVESAECFDYVVSTNLNLGDGVLTIQPGVVVGFEQGLSLTIGSGGGLVARGHEQRPILLTGTEPARGHWRGVFLVNSDYPSNQIVFTTIEYGGGGTFSGSLRSANLTLMNARLQLVVSTLRESAEYGLYMHFDASLTGSSDGPSANNVFTGNASGPAYVYASVVPGLVCCEVLAFSGNDRDVLDVRPNTLEGPNEWDDPGIPYHIVQDIHRTAFQIRGDLTLLEGVTIEFAEDMGMVVLEGGSLTAAGSDTNPVVLTGAEKIRGHWGGVGSSGDLSITLNHAVIEYGGGERVAGSPKAANLQVNGGGVTRVVVNNTVLRESLAYGLYAATGTTTPDRPEIEEFSGNTLTANGLGAAFVDAPHVDALMDDGTYTGNDIERIHVCSCSTASLPITGDATWRDLGVPYVMDGVAALVVEGGALTVEPGVEIRFPADMGLNVREGTLSALGTADDPITFRADGDANWRGIFIVDGHGDFDHFGIHDGGSVPMVGVHTNIAIATSDTQNPPSSTASFTANVVGTGADYTLAFGYGDTYAIPCPGPVYIPPPDVFSDHCRPF